MTHPSCAGRALRICGNAQWPSTRAGICITLIRFTKPTAIAVGQSAGTAACCRDLSEVATGDIRPMRSGKPAAEDGWRTASQPRGKARLRFRATPEGRRRESGLGGLARLRPVRAGEITSGNRYLEVPCGAICSMAELQRGGRRGGIPSRSTSRTDCTMRSARAISIDAFEKVKKKMAAKMNGDANLWAARQVGLVHGGGLHLSLPGGLTLGVRRGREMHQHQNNGPWYGGCPGYVCAIGWMAGFANFMR